MLFQSYNDLEIGERPILVPSEQNEHEFYWYIYVHWPFEHLECMLAKKSQDAAAISYSNQTVRASISLSHIFKACFL